MIIPLPCKFGETADCNGQMLALKGVSWFKWQQGMEYTYFFSFDSRWHGTKFYTTFNTKQPFEITIPDSLLSDTYIKDREYPLKGTGYVCGVDYIDEKTYVDFIITSMYMAHVRVQCNDIGEYVNGGNILFPPSWDTEDKKERAVLKSFYSKRKQEIKEKMAPKQMTIFDFIN